MEAAATSGPSVESCQFEVLRTYKVLFKIISCSNYREEYNPPPCSNYREEYNPPPPPPPPPPKKK